MKVIIYFNEHFVFNPRIYTGLIKIGDLYRLDDLEDEESFSLKNHGFVFSFAYIF